jgi:hypothetical protein
MGLSAVHPATKAEKLPGLKLSLVENIRLSDREAPNTFLDIF